jgi:hypothetical protein
MRLKELKLDKLDVVSETEISDFFQLISDLKKEDIRYEKIFIIDYRNNIFQYSKGAADRLQPWWINEMQSYNSEDELLYYLHFIDSLINRESLN